MPPTPSQFDGSVPSTESPSQSLRPDFQELLSGATSIPSDRQLSEANTVPLLLSLPAAPKGLDDDAGEWDLHSIQGVSIAPPLLCAISARGVHVYRVVPSLESASLTPPPSAVPQKAALLARWLVPPGVLVRAAALAPNGSVLAVLTSGSSNTAALALLSPTTCKRRLRLALPPPLAQAVCSMDEAATKGGADNNFLRQESLTFFSASNDTLTSAPPPMEVIPPRLRRVFPLRVAPPRIKEDPASWAIAVSANGATFVQIFVFHRGYRRLHHQAFIPVPHTFSDGRLVVHSALKLHTDKSSTFLAATTQSSAFIAKGISFDEVVAQSDVSITTLAAAALDTNIAICTRANGAFAIAVHAGPTLHIHSTYVQAADVRAARLVIPATSNAPALIIVLTHDGVPYVVARIVTENENFPRIMPFDPPMFQNHNLHPGRWPCVPTAAAAISVHGSTVIAAFVSDGQIVVRFLDCTTFLSDTGP